MNKLIAKVDVDEEINFDHNSRFSTSESFQLDAEFKRKGQLDILASASHFFHLKFKYLGNGDDILHIKGYFPDQVKIFV